MKPWCTEPFITLENKVWGNWGLCCRSKPLPYSAKDVSPLDHFNGNTMKRIRMDMKSNNITDEIKTYCEKCNFKPENTTNESESVRIWKVINNSNRLNITAL